MTDIRLTVRLFGAFRSFGSDVMIAVHSGASVTDVKNKLTQSLQGVDPQLVQDSVLGNDHEIISDNAVFTRDTALALLPPVCGG